MSRNVNLEEIPLSKLGVGPNIRTHNVELELDNLATNIHAVGQSQAILVYQLSDGSGNYEVLEGQRRLNAFDQLNEAYPNQGYDKILAMVVDEPETINLKKSISLGANITQLPMTIDDIQKNVVELWKDLSNMKLVAETYGISEKTAKKYVKGARLNQRLLDGTTSGEIDDDPEIALGLIMEAADLINWSKENEVSDEKVLKTAKIFASKSRSEVVDITEEMKKDPEMDVEVAATTVSTKPKSISRKIVLAPEDDSNLIDYAKTSKQKPEIAASKILSASLKQLVPKTDE